MSAFHAFALAILQGVTELFPISSLGHAVIVPSLFGWPIDQHSPEFLPFIVVLHIGTGTALLLYFWRDWLESALRIFGRAPKVPGARGGSPCSGGPARSPSGSGNALPSFPDFPAPARRWWAASSPACITPRRRIS